MNLLGVALLLIPIFGVLAVMRNQRQRIETRAATVGLEADARGVRRTLADGRHEEVAWDEVNEVEVFTVRLGPHKRSGGGVVLYGDDERGCIVPLDRLGESGLVEHLHRLPGFDMAAFVKAVGADERAEREAAGSGRGQTQYLVPKPLQTTTTCWRRADATGQTAES